MKQILQNLKSGVTEVTEVPVPSLKGGQILVQTRASLLSAGTERMLVEFGQANLLQKARSQPDKVKQVFDKIRTDGLLPTLETVFNRLDEPLPLGYCNVGTVIEVGADVEGFAVGDRVASNGNHAEFVCVPKNLCAKIPDTVSDEEATFTVLGSIGLQGVRLIQPELGQRVVVFGAGLIGLVVVQLLRASGCHVLAVDLDKDRLQLARQFGAEIFQIGSGDLVNYAAAFSQNLGVDAVVITASAKTDEIVHQAAQMCRKRGKIVLVGVVGLNLQRSDFYEKELTFQVSCSYGPGRYDPAYEQKGQDYPPGFVRWTEQRNFVAMLDAIAARQIDVNSLITHRFEFSKATEAYQLITGNAGSLGVILQYPQQQKPERTISFAHPPRSNAAKTVAAVLGAGNFAKMTMVPALAKTSARLKYITARTNAAAAAHIARKFSFENATTDLEAVWSDKAVNTVFIATNHNSHAAMVKRALESGKHVFVEKPLCLNVEELKEICRLVGRQASSDKAGLQVMVGFNRRFSPHVVKIKELLSGRSEPLALQMTVNAGIIPSEHWVHDPQAGGGRIIGEACHFIDLMQFITAAHVVSVNCQFMNKPGHNTYDTAAISLGFADGSVGVVNYFANGNKAFPKESLQVFSEGRVLVLDNFARLDGHGFKGFSSHKTWSQDKGHASQFAEFVGLIEKGGQPLIPFADIVNVTLASFAAVKSGHERRSVNINREYADLLSD
ncbi:MAG: Sorbitol dehydrogenase [Candidatus Rifleibacterium amylolyticum]|nr:MAG: Sorbitol dehydrogenase [Candidatus Rifleibacterium amylolyticum]